MAPGQGHHAGVVAFTQQRWGAGKGRRIPPGNIAEAHGLTAHLAFFTPCPLERGRIEAF